MSNASIRKCELITRSIARWGSVVAAIMFGIAFLTDKSLSYAIVSGQALQIALVLAVFIGYLLAWKKRHEAIGSLLAIAAVGIYYLWSQVNIDFTLGPFYSVVALPALFHLLAVAFHRFVKKGNTTYSKATPTS